MNESDKNLLKNSAKNMAETLVSSVPPLAIAWALAKSLLGNALELRQQRALEFVEAIIHNPSVFTKQLLETAEFQDGFVTALRDYIQLRSELKRKIALRIFFGFSTSQDKDQFSLERLNNTLAMISAESIEFLNIIEGTLIPLQDTASKKDLLMIDLESVEYTEGELLELSRRHHPLSSIFDDWIRDNNLSDKPLMLPHKTNSKTPEFTGSSGYALPNQQKMLYDESISELTSLGLLTGHSYTIQSGGINQTRKFWNYTAYGRLFTSMLKQSY